jgi:hypothetical protein
MDYKEIETGVRQAAKQWSELSRYRQRSYELTDGAIHLLVQLVGNIEHDPSPHWRDFELDEIQRYVISTMPNMLVDIDNQMGHRWRSSKVSSWEILHEMSYVLNRWCPVPKDI